MISFIKGKEQLNFLRHFALALAIKGVLFFLIALLFNLDNPEKCVKFVFTYSGDATGYIEPVKNFVDKGVYYEYNHEKDIFMYASRSPGMLPLLGPLYAIFGLEWALALLAVIQFILDAFCCVLLGRLAVKILKNEKAFYYAFFLYAFSTIVSVSAHYAVSECLCTCFGIISIYFIFFAEKRRDYFFSGLFATWAFFFRPTAILLFLFLPLFLVACSQAGLRLRLIWRSWRNIFLLFLPLFFFESLWVGRNFITLNRFIGTNINLENFGNPAVWSVFNMLMDIGGDLQSWNPDSEMRWFNNTPGDVDFDSVYYRSNPFPAYIFEAGITLENLKLLREKYQKHEEHKNIQDKLLEKEVDSLAQSISGTLKNNAPLNYYLTTRLRILKTLVFIKRPYGLTFSKNTLREKLLRGWHFVWYYIGLVLFIGGCFFAFKHNQALLLFMLFIFAHIIMYGAVIRVSENRYLVPVYPFAILVGTAFLCKISEALKPWLNKVKLANDA